NRLDGAGLSDGGSRKFKRRDPRSPLAGEAVMTTAATSGRAVAHHLLALKVENRAGVLVRIAGLFSRRGFNIVSLAVAPTDNDRFSRLSIVVDADSAPMQQVRE